jgi:NAD(P)H-flavin reductase
MTPQMDDELQSASQVAANVATDPMVPRFLAIHRVVRESADTVTLTLADPGVGRTFAPGQFNMLYVFGAGEAAVSISGNPARPDLLTHTVRAVGSVTIPMAAMKRGQAIGVRGPFGRGWPVDEAERRGATVLLLAGGIGLPPLRPVLYHFLRKRGARNRLVLLYGARTPGDLLYKRELERWQRDGTVEVHIIVDRGDSSWRGRVGVLTDLLESCEFDPASTVAMTCGPEVMMRAVARALGARGIAASDIYFSMERNMKCATGLCGHCQFGPSFICKDGPVLPLERLAPILGVREV